MTWFKVDDGFWSHPKTASLSDAAMATWVRAGAYCCQHLTDGVVYAHILRLVGTVETAEELVAAGLWLTDPAGWRFHDWDKYQETSTVVEKRRDDARDRQRRSRAKREEKRREPQGESHVTGDVTHDVSNGVSSLPPTRPDPTRPDPKRSSSPCVGIADENDDDATIPGVDIQPLTEPRSPMIPIPDDWTPNDVHRAKWPRPDLNQLAEAFTDHATANGRTCHGRAGWDAAFNTWVRKSPPGPGVGTATTKAEGWINIANQAADQKVIS